MRRIRRGTTAPAQGLGRHPRGGGHRDLSRRRQRALALPSAQAAWLEKAGVQGAHGFFTNVSNFDTTSRERDYAGRLSSKVGWKHYVIDVSRNANGWTGTWCNPPGAKPRRGPEGDGGHGRQAGCAALGEAPGRQRRHLQRRPCRGCGGRRGPRRWSTGGKGDRGRLQPARGGVLAGRGPDVDSGRVPPAARARGGRRAARSALAGRCRPRRIEPDPRPGLPPPRRRRHRRSGSALRRHRGRRGADRRARDALALHPRGPGCARYRRRTPHRPRARLRAPGALRRAGAGGRGGLGAHHHLRAGQRPHRALTAEADPSVRRRSS
ncbi:glycoside hydrolase family 6 protein [Leifsonia sp. L25]|uniref:glycoside hydrolase family 6 protein n=1 Tax=Leifsonia sp. L25 TaxID=3423957 RepID=UPI003D69A889